MLLVKWRWQLDLNQRPLGREPTELTTRQSLQPSSGVIIWGTKWTNFSAQRRITAHLNSVVVLDGLGDGQAPLQGQHHGREDGGHDRDALKLKQGYASLKQLFSAYSQTATEPMALLGFFQLPYTAAQSERFFFKYFPSALTPNNFRTAGSQKKIGFDFLPADRGIEPGTAGWEARTLPLCYAVPPKSFLS